VKVVAFWATKHVLESGAVGENVRFPPATLVTVPTEIVSPVLAAIVKGWLARMVKQALKPAAGDAGRVSTTAAVAPALLKCEPVSDGLTLRAGTA
jgi:hypothetical protein